MKLARTPALLPVLALVLLAVSLAGCAQGSGETQPTCTDGVRNGDEEGVDCGGSCPACQVPTCDDGVQNGDEEGVDCGGSCPACQAEPSRYFASVPFILDWPDSLITGQHIAVDSNMLALNFAAFYGVPWDAFINDTPFPAAWLAAVDETAALVDSLDLPVYLALTPLGDDYKTLAADSEVADYPGGDPCADLSARPDWDALRTAYAEYVEYMVDRFDPKFLVLSIEMSFYFLDGDNRIDQACVDNWGPLRDMFNDIYAAQKARRPDMAIFYTFQAEKLWNADSADADCYGYSETCLTEKLALLQDLSMDLFGLSTYPLWSYETHQGVLPDNYLSIFQEQTGLPLAIGETGWQHTSISIDDPNDPDACIPILYSDEDLQLMWMNRLLAEAESLDMPLVVWWSDHDVLPADVGANCRCSGSAWCELLDPDPLFDLTLRFFGSMGLRDYDGNPRPCLQPWQDAVSAAAP